MKFLNTSRISVVILVLIFPLILQHCADRKKEVDRKKPDDNRFTPVVLTPEGSLDEPMMFQVANSGEVFIIERKGALKKFDPSTRSVKRIADLSVYTHDEQGLIGLALDPDFENNQWIYLQYAPADTSIFRLERFTVKKDTLEEGSGKIILEFPVDRAGTNHTGGGMAWDKNGNLYLTVGNNTGNGLLAQTDERPGKSHMDDQRAASNTNDLRGKILRIHPEKDGTYTIPKGNLFPPGTPKTRPEIYTMGHRNVWRVFVDSKTGWIYWGEIGPDQDADSETGPRGYDEQNQAKGPGFFGWPYFIANNRAIPKYDYVNNTVGDTLDPMDPVNESPNNTGLRELPPAQPALIYYPYGPSEEFPLVGSSSRCAIGGPVYRRDDFKNPERPFPAYYEGKWLIADFSRFWIMAVTLDEAGNYVAMERFAPDYHPVQPLDIKFGPEGDLYVLEYGSNTVRSSQESRLVRIEYNAGNRKPVVKANASARGGAVPFTLRLSAEGTVDHDGDRLQFQWTVGREGEPGKTFNEGSPEVELTEPGIYTATLVATDDLGEKNSASLRIVAGNDPPDVRVKISGNRTFFFENNTVAYSVEVTDKEDGPIPAEAVVVSIDYVSEGFDFAPIFLEHAAQDAASPFAVARALIKNSDCRSCHTADVKAFGPSFKDIALRYKNDPKAWDSLAYRIIKGSSGMWGNENNMPAHPTLSENDARILVNYILSFGDRPVKTRPEKGSFTTIIPPSDNGKGSYIFRAAYTDRGSESIPSLTSDTVVILRNARLNPLNANSIEGGALRDQLDEYVFLTTKPGSYIVFKNIDLSGIGEVIFRPNWHLYDIYPGGKIEVRLGHPEGELIGETVIEPEQFNTRYRGAFGGLANPTPEKMERSKRFPKLNLPAFFARGSDKNSFTIPSAAELNRTEGHHDIYFVFKRLPGREGESLFPLAEIKFMLRKDQLP